MAAGDRTLWRGWLQEVHTAQQRGQLQIFVGALQVAEGNDLVDSLVGEQVDLCLDGSGYIGVYLDVSGT
jgi:hypothetical protein